MHVPSITNLFQQPLPATTSEPAQFGQEKLATLKARAQVLAHVPEETESATPQLEIAEFRLGGETYACISSSIREVYPLKGLTPLPCTPPFILGMINVRGRILPVIDVKPLLGLSSPPAREFGKVVILHAEEMEVGLLVDTIVGVRVIPTSILHPPFPTLTGSQTRYIRGITSDGTTLLDAINLLTGSRLGTHA